jgi:hydrogenase/urease accessory protein HupE
MKGLEQFTDLFAMAIGMVGALAKSIKKKLKISAIFTSVIVAGILSYSLIGVVEIWYDELTPKLVIGISFVVGWLANEITEKIDLVFDDLWEYLLARIKKLKK